MNSLNELEARIAHDLACLQLPAAAWVPERQHEGEAVAEVLIIGGGMAGLTLAAALKLKGIRPRVLDEAAAGFEGPWVTTARMETLRSPKQLAGPALGIPSLTFRAWFEAQFGTEEWERLDKIARVQWMDYLRWYRQVLGIEVQNLQRVTDLKPRPDGLVELWVQDLLIPGTPPRREFARRLVLATGRAGLGGPSLPDWAAALPQERWLHSSDEHDYAGFKGQRVAVIGVGASAMDSAATALEEGAAHVHLLARRPDIPRINKGKGGGSPGFVHGHARLPDAWKWRIRHYINTQQVPPPRGSTLRVSRHANAHFHLGCTVEAVAHDGQGVHLRTNRGALTVDRLIFATGFEADWSQRPFLQRIAPQVRLWKDRFEPTPGEEDAELAAFPDLGPVFEFQPRTRGASPGLDRIHCFCYPAALSLGVITGDIPAITEGAQRLATELAGLLYVEDIECQFERLQAYAEPEVFGDEWQDEPLP
jgi:FAD-dependent urate hydroxylase